MTNKNASLASVCLAMLALACTDDSGSNDKGVAATGPSGGAGGSGLPSPSGPGVGTTATGGPATGPGTVAPPAGGSTQTPVPGVGPMGSPSASPTGATGATGATGGATGTTGPVPTAPVGAGGTVVGTGGSTSGAGGTSSVGGNPSMGGSSGAGTGGSTGGSAGVGAAGAPVLGPDVTVQLGMTKQEMVGFGINNNWSPALSDSDADRLFGTGEGQLGLTVLRIGMGPNGTPYNGNDCWSDITKATERGAEYIIGTLWTPPANMKSNNSISGGGHLLPEYYEEWSDTIAAFPAMVKDNTGVDLYAMSPQNETDFASCGTSEPCNGNYDTTIYTGQEYADFAAIVGPKLHALNPPVKLMSPEASEWLHLWSNESACCSEPGGKESSDPLDCGFPATNCTDYNGYDYGHALFSNAAAWEQVDIIGTHQYDTQVAEPWPDDVPDKKPLWQTEMSGVKWWPEQGPSTDIQNGVAVAGWIHSALTVGDASAWLWWWYKAMGATNEGLLLSDGTVAKRMWTLGNYSRFIRPGYMRVDVTGDVPENALLTAFSAPDGTVVVVAVNKGSDALEVPITIAGGTAPAEMSTWVTSATEDLAASDAVTVTGGIFMASLPGTTVTTFVGK